MSSAPLLGRSDVALSPPVSGGTMRVLHIIDNLRGGGAEQSLVDVAPHLRALGIEVEVATLLDDDGVLRARLRERGFVVHSLSGPRPVRRVVSLRSLIRARRPDVVHTTLLWADLCGRTAARAANVPVVSTLANLTYGPEHRATSSYGRLAVRGVHGCDIATARLVRRFQSVSASIASTMAKRLHVPDERVDVVWRGRDEARLGTPSPRRRAEVRASLGIPGGTPVVLAPARLADQKGVDTSIRAFAMLRERRPDAVLLIAGGADTASALVEQLATSVGPSVRLLGHRSDVPDLMCAADVLSYPSRWEGFGGAALEAMALRLPVVASRIEPLVEALDVTAFHYVRTDDPGALATALDDALDGGPRVAACIDAAERRFRDHFTIAAAANRMGTFYERVLGSANPS